MHKFKYDNANHARKRIHNGCLSAHWKFRHSNCSAISALHHVFVWWLSLDMTAILFTIWAASWQNQQSECAPSEDTDQPGHPPSLIRVFTVRMKKAWTLSYPLSAQRRLWSDSADALADLSLRWAHSHVIGFVTRRLILAFFAFIVVKTELIMRHMGLFVLLFNLPR